MLKAAHDFGSGAVFVSSLSMQDLVQSGPDWYLLPAGRLQHTAPSILDGGALDSRFEIQLPEQKVSAAGTKQSC